MSRVTPRNPTVSHMRKLEKIKIAAAQQFYAVGYAATDMRGLADAVNLHVSTLYTYVTGKEELLYLIMKDGMAEITAAFDKALASTNDPIARMEAAIEAHLMHHATRRFLAWTGQVELRSITGDYREEILRLRDDYEARWLELIRAGQRSGVFAASDAKVAAYVILGMGHSVASWYRPDGRLSAEKVAERIAGQLLNGLLAR